ncbi:hypothetical protein BFJ68_g15942 [Fusarium oxysporum]|uniref:Uncharacterized protein n=1 Tax=Fusarium oxysporum TaxID=5507 RepID=A0A420PIH1_FUSOX|nr:hypothetical protein BFJ68_g15942 [Fusarium oxysporum]
MQVPSLLGLVQPAVATDDFRPPESVKSIADVNADHTYYLLPSPAVRAPFYSSSCLSFPSQFHTQHRTMASMLRQNPTEVASEPLTNHDMMAIMKSTTHEKGEGNDDDPCKNDVMKDDWVDETTA